MRYGITSASAPMPNPIRPAAAYAAQMPFTSLSAATPDAAIAKNKAATYDPEKRSSNAPVRSRPARVSTPSILATRAAVEALSPRSVSSGIRWAMTPLTLIENRKKPAISSQNKRERMALWIEVVRVAALLRMSGRKRSGDTKPNTNIAAPRETHAFLHPTEAMSHVVSGGIPIAPAPTPAIIVASARPRRSSNDKEMTRAHARWAAPLPTIPITTYAAYSAARQLTIDNDVNAAQ